MKSNLFKAVYASISIRLRSCHAIVFDRVQSKALSFTYVHVRMTYVNDICPTLYLSKTLFKRYNRKMIKS